jgi:hypothetical protein
VTRELAIAAARAQCTNFGKTLAVYRLPAWKPDVYGVRDVEQLPREAETFESFAPDGPPPALSAPPPPTPARQPKVGQRSLF